MKIVLFISTTEEMLGERELLRQAVLPELMQLAEQRRCALEAIELTWGALPDDFEAVERLLAATHAVEEADDVRQIFLCLLGERYGEVCEQFPPALLAAWPFLEHEAGRSPMHSVLLAMCD